MSKTETTMAQKPPVDDISTRLRTRALTVDRPGQVLRSDRDLLEDAAEEIERLSSVAVGASAQAEKWAKTATDRRYMMDAYRLMLGPKGLEVAAMWDRLGIIRQHTSWGPDAAALSGEERAQCHLDVEAAPKSQMLPGKLDGEVLS